MGDDNRQEAEKVWYINNGVQGAHLGKLPKCTAIAPSTGRRCRNPAMRHRDVCCVHAGLYHPGAPYGNRNARRENRKDSVSKLIAEADELLKSL